MKNLWRTWLMLVAGVALAATDGGRGVTVAPVAATARTGNAGLFVGVNQFTEDKSLRPLQFAVNDAIAQAYLFVLDLKLLPPASTFLALSGEPTSASAKAQLIAVRSAGVQCGAATKPTLLRTLYSVSSAATGGDDLLIVSLSSHGFEERGVAYVLPADGLHTDLQETGVNLGLIEQRLSQSKAGKRLLLVDACRENPTASSRGSGDLPMSAAFRSALAAAEGQAVLASCDAGQLSLENPDLGHGIFTFFLLDALKGKAAADARGFITLGAVKDYVAQAVHDWVVKNRPGVKREQAQHPWFKGPAVAEQIPLAMDSGIQARLGVFKSNVAQTIESLKTKINRKGEFNAAMYERVAEKLEQAQDNEAGQKLLAKAKDFVGGKLDEETFVAYIEKHVLRKTPGGNANPMQATRDLPWVNSLGMKFASVKGTDVLFSIWDTRVQDYQAFVNATKREWTKPDLEQGPTHPSVNVSWDDARAFCKWLTEKERAEGRLTARQEYRLPTDAEWSIAVGLGSESGNTPETKNRKIKDVYPWGTQWPPPKDAGNYGQTLKIDNYELTSPVGMFTANKHGLFDMGGNVNEFCEDWYEAGQRLRVLRGASFASSNPEVLLSSSRFYRPPDCRGINLGFRVVIREY